LEPKKIGEFIDEEKIVTATGFRDGSMKCDPVLYA